MPLHLLERDLAKGKKWALENKVGFATFSGGNYQIEVKESPKKKFFPFLNISETGALLEGFCSCKTAEEQGSCPHLAAAYITVCAEGKAPLHIRFNKSLWNELGKITYERYGNLVKFTKKKEGVFEAVSTMEKLKITLASTEKRSLKLLKELLIERQKVTEETSLKFSHFSPEEITLWKQGKPSPELGYALSFWADLATLWIQLAEKEPSYTVSFDEKTPLKYIKIAFPSLTVKCELTLEDWEKLIPYLNAINAPFKTYALTTQEIQKIHYHPKEKTLSFDKKGLQIPPLEESVEKISVGPFWFIPPYGFFPKRIDPLLNQNTLTKEGIKELFERHESLLFEHLDPPPHLKPIEAKYHLFFDSAHNLHIALYAFTPHDVQQEDSCYFGPWVYLAEKGFYKFAHLLFKESVPIILKEELSNFINLHRIFLNQQAGFQTHVSSIESTITYHMTEKNVLHFTSLLDLEQTGEEVIDFGEWIYIKNKGFFTKKSHKNAPMLPTPLKIAAKNISSFIKAHLEELEGVKDFFTKRSPLEQSGLNILLTEEKQILIEPAFTFFEEDRSKPVEIFGDFTYVAGEGFCEIPEKMKLPDGYTQKRLISASEESFFIHYELEHLRPFALFISQALKIPTQETLSLHSITENKTQHPYLTWDASFSYTTDLGSVALSSIWKAIQENKRYLFSDAGLILLKQPRFLFLKNLSSKSWTEEGLLHLSTLDFLRLSLFDEIVPPQGDSEEEAKTRAILEHLGTFQADLPINLQGLKSDLRPYQETGVKWLWFLYTYGLSGLLCDEMGLGKTHQAMALLAAASNQNKESHFLIVCPTSVIYHWEELLKRFLPHLPVHIFHGLKRALPTDLSLGGIILTSYGILRSEKTHLQDLPFAVVIFDEIQVAKNTTSQTHKALKKINANMRVGLTGTPIENHLLDLKALFDLVLPGYMPNESLFRDLFVSSDPKSQGLLSKMIHPFMLRRRKKEVLLELPEKTEEIAYCDLSEEQSTLYKKYFLEHKDSLLNDLSSESGSVPYLHVFSLLSKLKQICDHPCLITKQYEDFDQHASGKWDLFVELLSETRASGQKLVVFSQYLDMLSIIETYLKQKNIGFAAIRGSTRNRKEELERFKTDPSCEVFVASLQAVGVGVDLVSASVVIHYDRWWNPAKENQATDRVHRIGQNRGVQVFKMVTKNTIEEHIHQLIEKKTALTEGVLHFDEQDHLKSLNREEILHLLELIDKNLLSI